MTDKAVLTIARGIDKALAKDHAEYLAACDEWSADGFRPHYCEHGTNTWTDYDNICGPCEDGISLGNPLTRRKIALVRAHRAQEKVTELINAASIFSKHGIPFSWEKVSGAIDSALHQ
jgi:hypothetical protein